jgi:hypothetical protein
MLTFDSAYNASTIPRKLKVNMQLLKALTIYKLQKKKSFFFQCFIKCIGETIDMVKSCNFKHPLIHINLVFFWWIGTLCGMVEDD